MDFIPAYKTIKDYISSCDITYQPMLQELYTCIKLSAPEATEKISYGMPTFYLHGNLIHFALQKKHIGLYPTPSGIEHFHEEFEYNGFHYTKGAVQFPLDQPLPLTLIKKIVCFRVNENKK